MHMFTLFERKPMAAAISAIFSIGFMVFSAHAHADCVDNGGGSFTCTGNTSNSTPITGSVTLDSTSGAASLNNQPNIKIINDHSAITQDTVSTIQTNGNNAATVENSGNIIVNRGDLVISEEIVVSEDVYDQDGNLITPAVIIPAVIEPGLTIDSGAFSADSNGQLLNNGASVGVASAIRANADAATFNFINQIGPRPNFAIFSAYFPSVQATGDYSAALYGNAAQINITNKSLIANTSYSFTLGDTLGEGHWAIANYGAGLTTLNNINPNQDASGIQGDIVLVDRNPLLLAAQKNNPSLVLAHAANEVGVRNSVINNGYLAFINGNIYLGNGEHVINNEAGGYMTGNIYIDQRDAEIIDVVGGVATTVGTVSGAKTFTLTNNGTFNEGGGNEIRVDDVVGSLNTFNFNLSSMVPAFNGGPYYTLTPSNFSTNIFTNGLGDNTVNLRCFPPALQGGCTADATLQVSTVNISSNTFFDIRTLNVAGGNVNLNSNVFFSEFGAITANTVTIGQGYNFYGYFGNYDYTPSNSPFPAAPDAIGVINANLINNGRITVRDATLVVNGDATFTDTSSLAFRILPTGNGKVDVQGGTGTFSNNSTLIPTFRDIYIRSGDTFTVATNSSGQPNIINSGIVQFTSSDSTGDIVLTANNAIPQILNPTKAGTNAVMALMNAPSTDPVIAGLQLEIQGLDNQELQRATERLRPEIHDGVIRMVLGNTDRTFGILENRLVEQALAGDKKVSVASLDSNAGAVDKPKASTGIWMQGFGYQGTQDKREGVDGFRLHSTGFVVGADRDIGADQTFRLGALFSFAGGNIDNSGLTDNNTINTNSYFAAIYGAWDMQDWYLNAAIGGGRHVIDTRRLALGRVATGEHDAWQFSSHLDAGYPFQLTDELQFIPVATLRYNHLDESGYKEKGKTIAGVNGVGRAGDPSYTVTPGTPIALAVDGKATDSFRSGIGAKALWNLQQDDWNANIGVHALWMHEFGDIGQTTTARFLAGGSTFNNPSVDIARESIVAGASVQLTGNDENDQVSLLASYEAEMRDKFFSHNMTMRIRYDFDKGPSYIQRANHNKAALLAKIKQTQLVNATEADINAIQQAIAPVSDASVAQSTPKSEHEVQIESAVSKWVNALANKNIEMYFNSYASEFTPPDGSTRQAWEKKRKLEISRDGNAAIKTSYLTITPNGNQATAVFTQTLTDGGKKQTLLKALDLIEKGGRWLIVSEDGFVIQE
ncbi:autotransporter outer membrane beta-barrel domain-containing protein [Methylotenera sp. 1P/1]|uniref:autotransporter outer membrane beta-barrel domain-containing protein n=1 Tax=Methylotenera sp. 1P/1 TaxID=1131551 RepID=UPI00035CAC58|nr:autotransporter outer membrane beta-barrel domain-containing protein [Methylotenera sp. 1P/1]